MPFCTKKILLEGTVFCRPQEELANLRYFSVKPPSLGRRTPPEAGTGIEREHVFCSIRCACAEGGRASNLSAAPQMAIIGPL